MKRPRPTSQEAGFSRLELMMVLVAVFLLATVALPVLAGTRSHAEQVSCWNNLRRIGTAVHLWGDDHGDRTPWFTPVTEGGTRNTLNPLRNNAYFQMGTLSNELRTPKILVCPSDVGVGAPRKLANDFSSEPADGGFFALGYRNNALSYFVGLHSYFWMPRSLLSGDRNIQWDGLNFSCVVGVSFATYVHAYSVDIFWTNAIHGVSGNLLFTDGAAEARSTSGLQQAVQAASEGDNSSIHFLVPN